jgi:hypothetical protein
MRAKLARQRNKKHVVHLLTKDNKFNYHKKCPNEIEKELNNILPSRKKWIQLGVNSRNRNGQPLNSIDKNTLSLRKTIKAYRKIKTNDNFLRNLDEFISDLKKNIMDESFKFKEPSIYPKLKEDKKINNNICRPISSFSLSDKIIISLTNKYLSNILDKYFLGSSYAFRATQEINGSNKILTHHDAFQKIIEYREKHKGKKLWVAECDMMKFYDSVNHTIIKKSFNKILNNVKRDNHELLSNDANRIFIRYLDCYTFNKNVYPKNKDPEYFIKFNINDGKFEWIHRELMDSGHYKKLNNAKIGVPQGGALSGLIANIVLDYADKKVMEKSDKNILYLRYCDDMIVIHTNKQKCQEAVERYKKALRKLKLIPHDFDKKITRNNNSFWTAKSKKPYLWDSIDNGGFPWIGFVGYQINNEGSIRVRKSSLHKEFRKQFELVNQLELAISKGKQDASNGTIQESLINRLIGMSVGRVKLWNFDSINNEMCWINGFNLLNDNKYSRAQLKSLDKNRNRLYYKFKNKLSELKKSKSTPEKKTRKSNREVVFYGKPFSYYYQAVEKKINKAGD